ncbi:hypothetical protein BOFL111202_21780 [Bordetella flabilis]
MTRAGRGVSSAMKREWPQTGPRRLTMSTFNPPWVEASASRSGAGEAWPAARAGRRQKNSVCPPCAARCSRRRDSGRTWGSQHSRAAQLPFFKTCSAAHKASAGRAGFTHSSRAGSRPQLRQAAIWGMQGGCTSTMLPWPSSVRRAGCSSRISPMPGRGSRSSFSAPDGQPPPGSSRVSSAWPVGTTARAAWASCVPRHRAGWICSGSRTAGVGMGWE